MSWKVMLLAVSARYWEMLRHLQWATRLSEREDNRCWLYDRILEACGGFIATVSMLTRDEETVGIGVVSGNVTLGHLMNRGISSGNSRSLRGIGKFESNGCEYPTWQEIDSIWN